MDETYLPQYIQVVSHILPMQLKVYLLDFVEVQNLRFGTQWTLVVHSHQRGGVGNRKQCLRPYRAPELEPHYAIMIFEYVHRNPIQ